MSTPAPPGGPRSGLEGKFRRRLDEHGYGFQYAVRQRIIQLFEQGRSVFKVEVGEFPVEHRGKSTHIDLILRMRRDPLLPFFLVAECKRANPVLCDWCFVRTPETADDATVAVERVMVSTTSTPGRFAKPDGLWGADEIYDLAFPMNDSNKSGDQGGEGRRVIDDALAQVWRGTSGFIAYVGVNPRLLTEDVNSDFLKRQVNHAFGWVMPVIFTTANLWVSDVDLGASDLFTGTVPEARLTPKSWLWFKHNLSPDLRHAFDPAYSAGEKKTLQDDLRLDSSRHRAIVSVSGIEDFLDNSRWIGF